MNIQVNGQASLANSFCYLTALQPTRGIRCALSDQHREQQSWAIKETTQLWFLPGQHPFFQQRIYLFLLGNHPSPILDLSSTL